MKKIHTLFNLFMSFLILVFAESFREMRTVKVVSYDVKIPDRYKLKNFKKKKILFLSDFHEAENGAINEKVIEKVKKISPDMIIVGGDMLNGAADEDISPSVNLLNSLSDICPVYHAIGNHEKKLLNKNSNLSYLWRDYRKRLSKNVHFLINDSVYLSDNIKLYGLDIPIQFYKRIKYPELNKQIINSLVGCPSASEYNILLGHTPDFIGAYSSWGADLVLSGHFHGGMVRLPFLGGVISPRLKLFPRYDYGRYNYKSTTMLVTSGMGQHTVKIRLNNIPEILEINLI